MTNGENDHLFDETHLDLCPECGENPCKCKPETEQQQIIVQIAQLTAISKDTFVTEASTLQWKPGFWPSEFVVKPFMGNGRAFFQTYADSGSTLYRQQYGDIVIEVFND